MKFSVCFVFCKVFLCVGNGIKFKVFVVNGIDVLWSGNYYFIIGFMRCRVCSVNYSYKYIVFIMCLVFGYFFILVCCMKWLGCVRWFCCCECYKILFWLDDCCIVFIVFNICFGVVGVFSCGLIV